MHIYAIFEYETDELYYGPIRYVEANNIEEVKEIFPLCWYHIREIEVESVAWVKIQQQMG
jgi:hypothetical protein